MNRRVCIYISSLVFIALASCQRVVDVKLRNADKKYVIEGILTDHPNSCRVSITQTQNFSDSNVFPGISGATVTISSSAGTVTNLTETTAGVYTSNLTGVPGTTYTLQVLVNAQTFTATCTMPQPVALDSIYITDISFFNKTNRLVNAKFKDPAGLGNNYRFVEYIDNVQEKHIFVTNDELIDGRENTTTLYNRDSTLAKGDTIRVDMQCIDAPVYKYWFSLSQSATGESESASPANPVTNLTGGALGYFSAHTVRTKSIVAK